MGVREISHRLMITELTLSHIIHMLQCEDEMKQKGLGVEQMISKFESIEI